MNLWNALFILLLLGYAPALASQTVLIGGRVSGTRGESLSGATVIVSTDSLAHDIVVYTLTRGDGVFTLRFLPPAAPSGWITVRSLGYAVRRQKVSLHADTRGLVFTLPDRAETIEAVYVAGVVPDVEERGDTVVYNPVGFTLGDERSIGEVIGRMPGIQVDADGNVKYQGQAIEKILINGRDVLAEGSIAMNTLPPDFASSVELLTSYAGDDIAHNFRTRKRLALNLKSHRDLTLNGTVEAGGGLFSKYEAKTSLLSLLPKVSIATMANANNTGHPLFSVSQYLDRRFDLGSGSSKITYTSEDTKAISPRENEHRRAAGLGNINLVWNPTDRYRLTSSTIYTQGSADIMQEGRQRFLHRGETVKRRREVANLADRYLYLSQHVKQRLSRGTRFSLDMKTAADYLRSLGTNRYQDDTPPDSWRVREAATNAHLDIMQDFRLNYLLGAGWINAAGSATMADRRSANAIATNRPLLPFAYRMVDTPLPHTLRYSEALRTLQAKLSVRGAYPIYRRLHIMARLEYAGQALITACTALSPLRNGLPPIVERVALHAYGASLGLMQNRGFFQFNASVGAKRHEFHSPLPHASYRGQWSLESSAGFKLEFTSQHSLQLSAGRATKEAELRFFSQAWQVEAYNQYVLPSRLSNPFGLVHELSLRYDFARHAKRLTIWAEASYTDERHLPMTQTELDGITLKKLHRDGAWRRVSSIIARISKGLGKLPIDARLVLHRQGVRMRTVHAGLEGILSVGAYNAQASIESRFKGSPLNFALSAQGFFSTRRFQPIGALVTGMQLNYGIDGRLRLKSFTFSLKGKLQKIRYGNTRRRHVDLDFSAKYTWGKLSLVLSGQNLLHMRANEWAMRSISDVLETVTIYRRLPGYLLFTAIYRI